MKGRIIADWRQVNVTDRASRALMMGAVQAFMAAPQKPEVRAALQHFATAGDFPDSAKQIIEKYMLTASYDDGWREVFDVRDFTATNEDGFEILDMESGLSFTQVAPGAKAKISKMSGTKATVYFSMFGGGLNWSRTLFDDGKFWTLEDNAIAFRNQALADKAQLYYDLIDAIGSGQNLAWQAVTGSVAATDANYVAIRDMNTINKAIETILLAVANKGYGVNVKTPFLIVAPIQLMGRINRALGLLNSAIAGSQFNGVQYNVRVIYTTMLAATDKYYVCLPKHKAKVGERMHMTIYDQFDLLSYSDTAVGWERHGGAIGDTDQFQRCATA